VLLDWPAARAATDFSGETEFASSDPSKYPDTRSVVPYQPSNLNLLEIGTNWFFMVRPPGYGSVASRFLFF
jgi:hypothetical protein